MPLDSTMTPRDFCYWFQGFIELSRDGQLDGTQLELVKQHLQLVFTKETQELEEIVLGDFLTTISC